MAAEKDIYELSLPELEELVVECGDKKFRSKQVYEWLHKHAAMSYEDMHNVPKALKERLSEKYPLVPPALVSLEESVDGTKKYLFELQDGKNVESVLIPSTDGERFTTCISTQVGCPMACSFCATGKQGFTRNLTATEIVNQVAFITKESGERISNIVVMGQGEPFLNFENTVKAIERLNSDEAFKIAARKITVSTCGVIPGIEKFVEVPEQFGLSVSLHSAEQAVRDRLMPNVKNYPLERLSEALSSYVEKTNRRVTFEYLMAEDVNDTNEALASLIEFCDGLLCHVNLLKLNEVDGSELKPSSDRRIRYFEQQLEANGIAATIRASRGSDISGACGQLANKVANK